MYVSISAKIQTKKHCRVDVFQRSQRGRPCVRIDRQNTFQHQNLTHQIPRPHVQVQVKVKSAVSQPAGRPAERTNDKTPLSCGSLLSSSRYRGARFASFSSQHSCPDRPTIIAQTGSFLVYRPSIIFELCMFFFFFHKRSQSSRQTQEGAHARGLLNPSTLRRQGTWRWTTQRR